MNTNTFPAIPSFATLVESVLSSGLVPDDEWTLAHEAAKGDPQELAKLLTAQGLLTQFQIAALSEGRGAALRVGNYDVLDRLGAGGMGTVFKARHRRMKRVVALKVLAANLSENPVFVKRFQREVETIASLGHPNVVMAYDADEAEVGHFLVMEFVNGLDLAACIERFGSMPLPQAVNCILQAARGLAYAHSQEIIHRDIKPHNLLLDGNGVVKVTDLGLARLNHGAEGPAAGTDVTMAGGVIGTADYMPPEQAVDSTTIDHRADIYSLGCTLHYLLTGKPPYSAPTIMSLLLKHRDAEIPALGATRPESPPQLNDLFRRMMAKQPEQRVQQMSEVVAELEAIASTLDEYLTGEVAKMVKYVWRFESADRFVIEVHDLPIGENNTKVFEIVHTRG
jgi:serine/threonine protein kinase